MDATNISRKIIQAANSIVNIAISLIVLFVLIFDAYTIWDSNKLYEGTNPESYEIYKPITGNENLSFQELKTINPEVFAWLTVYGTHIDYPVTQSTNNLKYINTNVTGEPSLFGNIFLDCNNNQNFSDFSNILYGHHMEKQAMFGEIGMFADKDYFDERSYGKLYYGGQEVGLEFFAFIYADAYDRSIFRTTIIGQEHKQEFLDLLLGRAVNARESSRATVGDHLVLLSTCSPTATNGRDILIGKITNEIHDNPFKTEKINNITQKNFWERLPLWIKIFITVLPFLIILLIFIYIKKRRSKKKEDDE